MKLRPEEITSILKQRIAEANVETDLAEVGTVLEIGDGIARVYGLENCVAGEMLDLGADVTGVALNLEEDNVGVALFGDWESIGEGDPVKRTGAVISVPVGEELVGRIVNPLGTAQALSPFGETAGAASALLGFWQMMAAAIGVWLAATVSPQAMFALGLVLTVASLAAAAFVFSTFVPGCKYLHPGTNRCSSRRSRLNLWKKARSARPASSEKVSQ